jgi:hypothetical protein
MDVPLASVALNDCPSVIRVSFKVEPEESQFPFAETALQGGTK